MRECGCDILIVEDEFLIAMDLQSQLEAAGYSIRGPVASVEEGLAMLEKGAVCAAILDLNIRGSTSLPIAERLAGAGTPFMFLSGNDVANLQGRFSGYTVLTKPINYGQLLGELKSICGF